MDNTTKQPIDKDLLIEKLARTDFTKSDVRTILDRLIQTLEECALTKTPLSVRSFGELKFTQIPARKGFDKKRGSIDLAPAEKVVFRLAENIRKPKLPY